MTNIALITGASSGLGAEFARIHAAKGGDLVLVARRKAKLDALKKELEGQYKVEATVVAKDLSAPGAAEELYKTLKTRKIAVDILINNAGFGGHGLFHERDWEGDRQMINLNVLALTALARAALPDMIKRGGGRILNVASMAGFLPGPLQATYYATKAYVQSFSQALAKEVAGSGVTVTALCPGATATEFADVADMAGVKLFKSGSASADSVAAAGYDATLEGKALVVPGVQNKLLLFLLRLMPRGLITKISRGTMEKA